jgi:hypothetical protein
MARLQSIELPDALLESIKKRATARGISVEEQVILDLKSVEPVKEPADDELTEEELLQAIRRDREAMAARGVWLTQVDIDAAKRWGRK